MFRAGEEGTYDRLNFKMNILLTLFGMISGTCLGLSIKAYTQSQVNDSNIQDNSNRIIILENIAGLGSEQIPVTKLSFTNNVIPGSTIEELSISVSKISGSINNMMTDSMIQSLSSNKLILPFSDNIITGGSLVDQSVTLNKINFTNSIITSSMISNISASQIVGSFTSDQLPSINLLNGNLSASKILGQLNSSQLPALNQMVGTINNTQIYGSLTANQVPPLNMLSGSINSTQISGSLFSSQVPSLNQLNGFINNTQISGSLNLSQVPYPSMNLKSFSLNNINPITSQTWNSAGLRVDQLVNDTSLFLVMGSICGSSSTGGLTRLLAVMSSVDGNTASIITPVFGSTNIVNSYCNTQESGQLNCFNINVFAMSFTNGVWVVPYVESSGIITITVNMILMKIK